ncbi:universal stress protein [Agrococcus carbonis]|uniref:Nucleotide-binding universal stress protein, UspA family n=1 Tax=Agrococcus carbonis TaxID=684552 RepID=A0A1H1T2R6_9MICO|nr:universal stress protein [Agrococcus carbonis]SDS54565.1 Nucleotide-binding universal stress protein, UspA family [Agrococcus carbonis]
MTEHVVVAVDGGPASAAALDWVVDRARTVEMRLEITTVVDIDWFPQPNPDPVLAEYERIVDEAGKRVVFSHVPVDVSTTLHHARPVPGIVDASRRADLLVIGSHKTRGLSGIVNGTLPLAVAARTQCPLVVVPVDWAPGDGPVVVGVDDETGHAAMAFAAGESVRADAPLLAVRAWEIPPLVSGAWAALEAGQDEFEAAERTLLDTEVERMRQADERVQVEAVLEHGRPSIVLARRAASARLTVVGTHGRGALAGLLLGSVGHDLLMNMPSPIAIVPDRARAGHGTVEEVSTSETPRA